MNSTKEGLSMSEQTVWVLRINHRHGTDISEFATEEKAREALVRYVIDNWDDDISCYPDGPEEIPADPQTAVSVYFSFTGDEYYEISSQPLVAG
jgi:hypothetical protein